MDNKHNIKILVEQLTTSDLTSRRNAAHKLFSLAIHGEDLFDIYQVLFACLDDEDSQVKVTILKLFFHLKENKKQINLPVKKISDLLNDPSDEVKKEANLLLKLSA